MPIFLDDALSTRDIVGVVECRNSNFFFEIIEKSPLYFHLFLPNRQEGEFNSINFGIPELFHEYQNGLGYCDVALQQPSSTCTHIRSHRLFILTLMPPSNPFGQHEQPLIPRLIRVRIHTYARLLALLCVRASAAQLRR